MCLKFLAFGTHRTLATTFPCKQFLPFCLFRSPQEVRSEASTPSAVYEVEHLREELGQLQGKIDSLEEALDMKEETLEEFSE